MSQTARRDHIRFQLVTQATRVVIKIGSGVLTRAEGLNRPIITQLTAEIAQLKAEGREVILVSSGAIAAGFKKMGLSGCPQGIPQKQAVAAIGQSTLMQTYEEVFAHHGLRAAQLLLTRDDLANRRRYLNARNTLFTLLNWGVIPIINANDTVMVDEIQFGDNDNLSAMISSLAGADLLIMLTDTEGLYDCDPRQHREAQLIRIVEKIDSRLEKAACHLPGVVGCGGMSSKVQAAKKASTAGIPVIIANGLTPLILKQVCRGAPVGTLFFPQIKKISSRQYWIAFNLNPRGEIVVDDGARQVLLHQGKSLLPAGIVKVHGRFGVGAPVRLADSEGQVFGMGLSNYSSQDITRIKGLKTAEIERYLGHKGYDEVVHRDNMVVFTES